MVLSNGQEDRPRAGTLEGSNLAAVSQVGKDQFPVLLASECSVPLLPSAGLSSILIFLLAHLLYGLSVPRGLPDF